MSEIFKVYYIPGYPGKNSSTAKQLSKFVDVTNLEYDPKDPGGSLQKMLDIIMASDTHPIIAASSLGGWYAEQIANKLPVDLVLWNPSLKPSIVPYPPVNVVNHKTPRTVYLGERDTIVPPINAASKYMGLCKVVVLEDTEHRMTKDGLELMAKSIKDHQCFLTENSSTNHTKISSTKTES